MREFMRVKASFVLRNHEETGATSTCWHLAGDNLLQNMENSVFQMDPFHVSIQFEETIYYVQRPICTMTQSLISYTWHTEWTEMDTNGQGYYFQCVEYIKKSSWKIQLDGLLLFACNSDSIHQGVLYLPFCNAYMYSDSTRLLRVIRLVFMGYVPLVTIQGLYVYFAKHINLKNNAAKHAFHPFQQLF